MGAAESSLTVYPEEQNDSFLRRNIGGDGSFTRLRASSYSEGSTAAARSRKSDAPEARPRRQSHDGSFKRINVGDAATLYVQPYPACAVKDAQSKLRTAISGPKTNVDQMDIANLKSLRSRLRSSTELRAASKGKLRAIGHRNDGENEGEAKWHGRRGWDTGAGGKLRLPDITFDDDVKKEEKPRTKPKRQASGGRLPSFAGSRSNAGRGERSGISAGRVPAFISTFSGRSGRDSGGRRESKSTRESRPDDAGPPPVPPANIQSAVFEVLFGAQAQPAWLKSLNAAASENATYERRDARGRVELAPTWRHVSVSKGEVLVRQGDSDGAECFIVATGIFGVEVKKEDGANVKVAQVRPGGVFGELALLFYSKRTATVYAEEDASAWALHRHVYQALLERGGRAFISGRAEWIHRLPLFASLFAAPAAALKQRERRGSQAMAHEQVIGEAMREIALSRDERITARSLQELGDPLLLRAGLQPGNCVFFILQGGVSMATRVPPRSIIQFSYTPPTLST